MWLFACCGGYAGNVSSYIVANDGSGAGDHLAGSRPLPCREAVRFIPGRACRQQPFGAHPCDGRDPAFVCRHEGAHGDVAAPHSSPVFQDTLAGNRNGDRVVRPARNGVAAHSRRCSAAECRAVAIAPGRRLDPVHTPECSGSLPARLGAKTRANASGSILRPVRTMAPAHRHDLPTIEKEPVVRTVDDRSGITILGPALRPAKSVQTA